MSAFLVYTQLNISHFSDWRKGIAFAKGQSEYQHILGILSSERIEKYINSNLLSSAEIFSRYGTTVDHPSTAKWIKESLNINFIGDAENKFRVNYMLMQKPFLDFAGIKLESHKGVADIVVVFAKDIVKKIATGESGHILTQHNFDELVIDSIQKNIIDVDAKNGCHVSLFLSRTGEIQKAVALVDTQDKGHGQKYLSEKVLACLSQISFRILGNSKKNSYYYMGNREEKLLDNLNIFVLYSIKNNGRPFYDINPRSIHDTLVDLFTPRERSRD